jgi:hypothetical protein
MASELGGIPYKNLCVLVVFLFFMVVLASTPSVGQEVPRLDVFGGYSYLRLDAPAFGYADYLNQNGWNIGATGNITRFWGVAVDVSGHYGSHLSVYNFLIGPQYSWRRERSKFYGHVLVGKGDDHLTLQEATRSEFTSVGLAVAAGGGFDWDVTPRFTFRVVQADYLHTHNFANGETNVRVSTGLVVHFGSIRRRRP